MKREYIVSVDFIGDPPENEELVRCKDCVYAEHTMFDNEYVCYFDEENESGNKRLHKGEWFCADGEYLERSMNNGK